MSFYVSRKNRNWSLFIKIYTISFNNIINCLSQSLNLEKKLCFITLNKPKKMFLWITYCLR